MSDCHHRSHVRSTRPGQGPGKGGKLFGAVESVTCKRLWQERDAPEAHYDCIAFLVDTEMAAIHDPLDTSAVRRQKVTGMKSFPLLTGFLRACSRFHVSQRMNA